MTDVGIKRGLTANELAAASSLIYEAFEQKVDYELRPTSREQALRIISDSFARPEGAHVATTPDGSVVGIVGTGKRGEPFSQITFAVLRREFGWVGALARSVRVLAEERALRAPRNALRVEALAVDRSCRGQGIGTRLLEAAIEEARREDFAAVVLEVVDTNPKALALYQRLGFDKARRIPTGFLTRGEGFGAFDVMRLKL